MTTKAEQLICADASLLAETFIECDFYANSRKVNLNSIGLQDSTLSTNRYSIESTVRHARLDEFIRSNSPSHSHFRAAGTRVAIGFCVSRLDWTTSDDLKSRVVAKRIFD